MSSVYIFLFEDRNEHYDTCKIGYTHNIDTRIKTLQTGSADPIACVEAVTLPSRKDAAHFEKMCHTVFWCYRHWSPKSTASEVFVFPKPELQTVIIPEFRRMFTQLMDILQTQSTTIPTDFSYEEMIHISKDLFMNWYDAKARLEKAELDMKCANSKIKHALNGHHQIGRAHV